MANEATISASLQIKVGNIDYRSHPSQYKATVTGSKGPSVGAITVSTSGTDVDFSQLTTPGLCLLRNLSTTNYVEYGIHDDGANRFYPLGEILPGEHYILRFSRNLQDEFTEVGTGTQLGTNRFQLKANGASVNVSIEAFEA